MALSPGITQRDRWGVSTDAAIDIIDLDQDRLSEQTWVQLDPDQCHRGRSVRHLSLIERGSYAMPNSYKVSFYNDLVNSYGKQFKVCQRSLIIKAAHSQDRAIEAAKRRFCRLEQVNDWRDHARYVEAAVVVEPRSIGVRSPDGVRNAT